MAYVARRMSVHQAVIRFLNLHFRMYSRLKCHFQHKAVIIYSSHSDDNDDEIGDGTNHEGSDHDDEKELRHITIHVFRIFLVIL